MDKTHHLLTLPYVVWAFFLGAGMVVPSNIDQFDVLIACRVFEITYHYHLVQIRMKVMESKQTAR